MTSVEAIQRKLIERAERPHYQGIRHKGLSGTICEDLLLKELRHSFRSSQLSFARGVIKFAAKDKKGPDLKTEMMSPQMDGIIYEGRPVYRTGSHVVVHLSQVKGVLEIKKWVHRKEMQKSLKNRLKEVRSELRKRSGRDIPVFFATFRYRDGGEIGKWKSVATTFSTPFAYCFFGRFTRNKFNRYPWQEECWKKFQACPYNGQYGRLVSDLGRLSPRNSRVVVRRGGVVR